VEQLQQQPCNNDNTSAHFTANTGDGAVYRLSVQTHLIPFSVDRTHISVRCNAVRA